MNLPKTFNPKLDLKLQREVTAIPEFLWDGWTKPEILKKWFCPLPWKTIECEIELVPGGIFRTVMQSPEGQKFPSTGCMLEIIPNRKLVWTSALGPGFRPSEAAPNEGFLFTGVILLEPTKIGTLYTALGLHSNEASRKVHEDMGFEQGWGIALDQLLALK